ncbi:hypothetical protein KM043_009269 [Ampulex compressa]|nr:hypothetical protein KM043_009269 [Ampulex compressa]
MTGPEAARSLEEGSAGDSGLVRPRGGELRGLRAARKGSLPRGRGRSDRDYKEGGIDCGKKIVVEHLNSRSAEGSLSQRCGEEELFQRVYRLMNRALCISLFPEESCGRGIRDKGKIVTRKGLEIEEVECVCFAPDRIMENLEEEGCRGRKIVE